MYEKVRSTSSHKLGVATALLYWERRSIKLLVKNLFCQTALLARLNSDRQDIDITYIFNKLLVSTIVDLYLPEMRLLGEAEVVRLTWKEIIFYCSGI